MNDVWILKKLQWIYPRSVRFWQCIS